MWVAGVNCWAKTGYSIGTPILNHCLHIGSDGNITMPYIVKTPEVMVDTIRAMAALTATIDDAVIIIGNCELVGHNISRGYSYEYSPLAIALNSNTTLTYANMRNGIITGLNVASSLTYTLPSGTAMASSTSWLGNNNQSFQLSIISLSTTTGNIIIAGSLGHTYVGNITLTTNCSYRCLTICGSLNTAITYRICT